MEKYQRKDIVGIERENERDENYCSKTNPQIDNKRTRLNFHFIKPHSSYIAFINQRLKDLAPKRKHILFSAVLFRAQRQHRRRVIFPHQ